MVNQLHKSRYIEEEYPHVKKDISVFKRVLLPIELWCLKALISLQRPASTRELYSANVLRVWKEIGQSNENLIKEITKTMPAERKKKIHDLSQQVPFSAEQPLNYPVTARFIRELETHLRKDFKASFSSYHTVKKALETLESWQILSRRKAESSNADFYWILHQRFHEEFNQKYKEILNL